MNRTLGLFLMLAVVLAGCGKGGGIVAKIGSDKIDEKMLQERLQEAPPSYQGYLNTNAGKKQFLDLLVRERIVLEAARQAGVDKKSEYTKAIAEFKKDQSRRMRDYEENLLMELYVRELHEKEIGTTDADVDKYYQEHKREFARPVEIVAKHILVASRDDADKALARIKAGEDFSKSAKEVSTDPVSAVRGGEIGPFRRGDLVPEFEKAVFGLKVGQVSEIVETQFGFHIIKKVSEKVLPVRPVEETKVEIKKILEKTRFDAWLEGAKKKYGVTVNYDMLSKIPMLAPAEQPEEPVTPSPQPGNAQQQEPVKK